VLEVDTERLFALKRLYDALQRLSASRGGPHSFSSLKATDLPAFGVYFFFEPGEFRIDSGTGPRVVRVGTHAISGTSTTSVWSRLKQHRGNDDISGGNHRGSIFRLLVGDAMQQRSMDDVKSWGVGTNASRDVRAVERILEVDVSKYLRRMEVVVADVPDRVERQALETCAIALLSNYKKAPIDAASAAWLGQYSTRDKVRRSALWNNRDVERSYDPYSLRILERIV
jgi:hypothetical protein